MIRIAVGYVAIVALCALLILLNPMDLLTPALRSTPDVAPAPIASVTAPETLAPAEGATTAALLAGLTAAAEDQGAAPAAPEPPEVANVDPLVKEMSVAVLEGLRGARPQKAASLEQLVAQALAEGQTDVVIDRIVNEAVADGALEAPAMLRTAEGKVDTAVLLASILAEAQGDEFGQGDLSEPSVAVDGGTLAMQVAEDDVLYTVRPGDSLGSLALRFYGDAGYYTSIFKANRQVMDGPESLKAGMRLLIPARSRL